MYNVCYGDFERDSYWLELMEVHVMRELGMSYMKDPPQEENKKVVGRRNKVLQDALPH